MTIVIIAYAASVFVVAAIGYSIGWHHGASSVDRAIDRVMSDE